MNPRVNPGYDPGRIVACTWSLPASLADDIARRAELEGIDPQELVRELFLQHLPEFVADALDETLTHLRAGTGSEGVDSS